MSNPTVHPLSEAVSDRQKVEGGNIHSIAAVLEVENAEPDSLPEHLRAARKGMLKAEEDRNQAARKLREAMAIAGQFQSKLDAIGELRSQIGTAETAALEYEAVLSNSNFSGWPFMVKNNGNRFGLTMREIALARVTAKEIGPLLKAWLPEARSRLQKAEAEAEQFRKVNRLEKPQNNSSHD
jgi:hypothetical protein